ncbi:MAG: hydantoinase/oxoprolinase family protein [Actinobacteria bacterium]|nr:hydantoinase/oxoprolinase family protein [Actinomycetota bacterium]
MSDGTRNGARFRIAVDTGGTFTDVVVSGDDGTLGVGKSLTTYGRVFDGFKGAVDRAAETLGRGGDEVLRAADVIVYGTTHATNAVLTGRTARTALLVTAGFADTLTLREGGRRNVFDSHAAYPPPYIPRRLTFELRERVSAEGDVLTPLDEDHAREVIASLADHDVEAVAVTLLWSIADDRHERRVGELIEELLPGTDYTLSVHANPSLREYRRASAASIDASLKRLMAAHLGDLRTDLEGAQFGGNLMVVTSEGAVLDVDEVVARPVLTINSGPSMAPLAGASAAPEADVVVVCDMGGTTFDVSIVERGRVRHTREAWLGEPFVGHLTGLSSVAVQSIGAGGGSIAWIDSGGLLRVGPQSARSDPGPAAYGLGGTLPTVTDACVVLGYLNPGTFGASFKLDPGAAQRAIDSEIGGPLGLSTLEAAQAIVDVSANHMASAIRQVTLEHGIDPRGALLVAGGGAGAMVAAALADLLDARQAVIPGTAGVLAAYGAHEAPIATEFLAPRFMDTGSYDGEAAGSLLDDLDAKADAFVERFSGTDTEAKRFYFVDARYPAQAWDIRVHLTGRPESAEAGARAIEEAFHQEHLHRNGTEDKGSRVEVLAWGVRAEIGREDERLPTPGAPGESGTVETDEVVFGAQAMPTKRYPGLALEPDQEIVGPAIVDEPTTTVVIPPGWLARLDEQRNFHLHRDQETA